LKKKKKKYADDMVAKSLIMTLSTPRGVSGAD
jgi:hypothetical protein